MTPEAAGLVKARRERFLAAMKETDLDVVVLGRQDNASYVCGMRRLWTAGTRPFGAGCVVVGATGRVHAMSSWDTGIEAPMCFDDLYPLTWNPATMAASMAAIDGLAEARRIGVDELTPSFVRAAARFAPQAVIRPADDLLASVRRLKLPGETAAIAKACDVAWAGVQAALAAPSPTCAYRAAIEAMAALGVTVASSVPRIEPTTTGVVIDIGVICDLYEGGVGGHFVNGYRTGSGRLAAACGPGAGSEELAAAATAATWSVRGLGMGFEGPVIDTELGSAERLEVGMVLSVNDANRRDVVAVTADGPTVLSKQPRP